MKLYLYSTFHAKECSSKCLNWSYNGGNHTFLVVKGVVSTETERRRRFFCGRSAPQAIICKFHGKRCCSEELIHIWSSYVCARTHSIWHWTHSYTDLLRLCADTLHMALRHDSMMICIFVFKPRWYVYVYYKDEKHSFLIGFLYNGTRWKSLISILRMVVITTIVNNGWLKSWPMDRGYYSECIVRQANEWTK